MELKIAKTEQFAAVGGRPVASGGIHDVAVVARTPMLASKLPTSGLSDPAEEESTEGIMQINTDDLLPYAIFGLPSVGLQQCLFCDGRATARA